MKKQIILFCCSLFILLLSISIVIYEKNKENNLSNNEYLKMIRKKYSDTGSKSLKVEILNDYHNTRLGYHFIYPEGFDIIDLDQDSDAKLKEEFAQVGLLSAKYGGEPRFKVLSFDQKEVSLEDFANKYKENLKSSDSLEEFVISYTSYAYRLDPKIEGGGQGYIFTENKNKEKIVIIYTFKNTIHEKIIKDFYLDE